MTTCSSATDDSSTIRFQAQKALDEATPEKPDNKISSVDAQVVAIAERLSRRCPVTILTTDLEHIKALVVASGAKNILVKLPS